MSGHNLKKKISVIFKHLKLWVVVAKSDFKRVIVLKSDKKIRLEGKGLSYMHVLRVIFYT